MLKAVSGLADVIDREGHAACTELYPKHDHETLEPRLSRHMFALSMGTLVGDEAIAEQLAWRDQRIAQLESERVHLELGCELYRYIVTGCPESAIANGADYRNKRIQWLEADVARRVKT